MPIDIYPVIANEKVTSSDSFGSEVDKFCQQIYDGCKGRGADVPVVIEALAKDATTRHKISVRYKEMYKKELVDLMKKEFGAGDFGLCMQFLALPADSSEVAMIKKATVGIGASVDVLYAILCGRTNLEMELLKNTYNKENTEDLNHLISSKLRGDNERLIQISMAANEQEYDPSIHTKEKAAEDTDFIHDEKNMFEIICAAPPKYLELINEVYEEQYGLTLEKAIEKGLGGKAKEGLLQTVGMKLRPIETIAKLIKHACAGMGTNELLLSTTIIRHQNVMDKVMAAHFELFKKTIHDRVRSECGGKFRDILLAVLNAAYQDEKGKASPNKASLKKLDKNIPKIVEEPEEEEEEEEHRTPVPLKKAAADVSTLSTRARRRREEAVRRLVADVNRRPEIMGAEVGAKPESQDWVVASTVASAMERGLDRDLHAELVQEAKDNAGRIGQICHDHSDAFLTSVGMVVALGGPAGELAESLQEANVELQNTTAGGMLEAAALLEHAKQCDARARTLFSFVTACRNVAILLERARKQAALGRPRAALDAVDEARTCLAAPVSPLVFFGSTDKAPTSDDNKTIRLEETPFGARAMAMLPKIENEVLMGARRGLNRWFLALRSGGDGAKAGRAVLRKCADSMALGPGQLGIGGHLPPSYLWRAKTADNMIARVDQNGKVARAVRSGYWFERDGPKEAQRLEGLALPGVERRAEAFAMAFGWYRCWEANAPLLVDITDMNVLEPGLTGSRHGLGGSRHGRSRTLGFRARDSGASRNVELSRPVATTERRRSPWAALLTPSIIFKDSQTRKEDDAKLANLPESIHPVRRAELAFNLLGRHGEFIEYYEQNRFGDTKIGGGTGGDSKNETRSSLSSLTGDDVSVGTDRIFFAKSLPHLCASVVGFSAVEAALELGNFGDDDEENDEKRPTEDAAKTSNRASDSASRFRDSSARYERSLVTELGNLLRTRATGASLVELARSSFLMACFRSALKIVHPSSSTRRLDKELLAIDIEIIMTALKLAQDEQLKATAKIVSDDRKEPLLVTEKTYPSLNKGNRDLAAMPEEMVGLPFGLSDMKQKGTPELEQIVDRRYSTNDRDEYYKFSQSVPLVVRSLHARAIACAYFALSQEELGQHFPSKNKGSGAAGYVLDCLEACVSVAAVGMQDGENLLDEGAADKAVQIMANISAVQHSLPRIFGTLMRGMCHVGMIRADQIEETFQYAEATLKGADNACDAQAGAMYTLVFEICRNKIDMHINYALDNFQWVSKSTREMPNAYCEGVIGYLRSVFLALGPMDEGSRAGLHFSCCGHVAERLTRLLTDRESDANKDDRDALPPISRIDAYGIKNLKLDVEEFQSFADSTGVPQLSECFNELNGLTSALLDRNLPSLLEPTNAPARRRQYPFLNLEKLGNILEKYVGVGLSDKLMGSTGKNNEMLMMEKKEVQMLLKLCRSQQQ